MFFFVCVCFLACDVYYRLTQYASTHPLFARSAASYQGHAATLPHRRHTRLRKRLKHDPHTQHPLSRALRTKPTPQPSPRNAPHLTHNTGARSSASASHPRIQLRAYIQSIRSHPTHTQRDTVSSVRLALIACVQASQTNPHHRKPVLGSTHVVYVFCLVFFSQLIGCVFRGVMQSL